MDLLPRKGFVCPEHTRVYNDNTLFLSAEIAIRRLTSRMCDTGTQGQLSGRAALRARF